MAHILLASPWDSDRAVLTAGSAAASMPVTNLLRPQPTDVWRATDLGSAYCVIDRSGCEDGVRLVWLGYHNGSETGTLRIRAADTEAGLTAAPAIDRTVSLRPAAGLRGYGRWHTAVWIDDEPQHYPWWRLDIDDATNPGGFFQAGRLYLCDPYQPALNIRYGWSIGTIEPSLRARSYGGQAHPTGRGRWRELRCTFQAAGPDADAEFAANLAAIQRMRGTSRDVLAIVDIERPDLLMDWTVYGLLTEPQAIVNPAWRLYEQPIYVEEWELP